MKPGKTQYRRTINKGMPKTPNKQNRKKEQTQQEA